MIEDCAAIGFSGEGRCIEPAVKGGLLCEHHACLDQQARVATRDWSQR